MQVGWFLNRKENNCILLKKNLQLKNSNSFTVLDGNVTTIDFNLISVFYPVWSINGVSEMIQFPKRHFFIGLAMFFKKNDKSLSCFTISFLLSNVL